MSNVQSKSKSLFKIMRAQIAKHDITGMAKEITYDLIFALAPLLIFLTAMAGWITQLVNHDAENPAKPVLDWMAEHLPSTASQFLEEPMQKALTTSPGYLLTFGGVLALWSGKNAMAGVIKGLNRVYGYDQPERNMMMQQLVPIGLTLLVAVAMGVAGILFLLGTSVGSDLANALGWGSVWNSVSMWLRWPAIALGVVAMVGLINFWGPEHQRSFRSVLPGSVFTVVALVISTGLLGVYFSLSGGYTAAYGTFGAVLAFMFWVYIASLTFLLGGVINAGLGEEEQGSRPPD